MPGARRSSSPSRRRCGRGNSRQPGARTRRTRRSPQGQRGAIETRCAGLLWRRREAWMNRARERGSALRRELGLRGRVDAEAVAVGLGLEVQLWPLEVLLEMQMDGVVVVAERLDPEWRRWVIAHAIGHRLLHPGNHLLLRSTRTSPTASSGKRRTSPTPCSSTRGRRCSRGSPTRGRSPSTSEFPTSWSSCGSRRRAPRAASTRTRRTSTSTREMGCEATPPR